MYSIRSSIFCTVILSCDTIQYDILLHLVAFILPYLIMKEEIPKFDLPSKQSDRLPLESELGKDEIVDNTSEHAPLLENKFAAKEEKLLAEAIQKIEAGEETEGVIQKLAKRAKSIAVGFTLMTTLTFAAGRANDAYAEEVKTKKGGVEDTFKRFQSEVDQYTVKDNKNVDTTFQKYQQEIERIDKENQATQERILNGDGSDGKSMQEKYYNWNQYSKTFQDFKKFFAETGVTDQLPMRFIEVLKEFPEFQSSEVTQRMLMDEQNFKRLIGEYAKMRYGKETVKPSDTENALQELYAMYQFAFDRNSDGTFDDTEKREFNDTTNEIMGFGLLRHLATK